MLFNLHLKSDQEVKNLHSETKSTVLRNQKNDVENEALEIDLELLDIEISNRGIN